MVPLIPFDGWKIEPASNEERESTEEKSELRQKYYVIAEGSNTETYYFKALVHNQRQLGFKQSITIRFLEKTDEDETVSSPLRLIEYANEFIDSLKYEFDKELDKCIIVFDADIYAHKISEYLKLLDQRKEEIIFGVTYPSFELFLLLHIPDSYVNYILPYEKEIIENRKHGKRRKIQELFTEATHMNPKRNKSVGELVHSIDIAIQQEKKINQNIENIEGKITSNIASVFEKIREP